MNREERRRKLYHEDPEIIRIFERAHATQEVRIKTNSGEVTINGDDPEQILREAIEQYQHRAAA